LKPNRSAVKRALSPVAFAVGRRCDAAEVIGPPDQLAIAQLNDPLLAVQAITVIAIGDADIVSGAEACAIQSFAPRL